MRPLVDSLGVARPAGTPQLKRDPDASRCDGTAAVRTFFESASEAPRVPYVGSPRRSMTRRPRHGQRRSGRSGEARGRTVGQQLSQRSPARRRSHVEAPMTFIDLLKKGWGWVIFGAFVITLIAVDGPTVPSSASATLIAGGAACSLNVAYMHLGRGAPLIHAIRSPLSYAYLLAALIDALSQGLEIGLSAESITTCAGPIWAPWGFCRRTRFAKRRGARHRSRSRGDGPVMRGRPPPPPPLQSRPLVPAE